MADRHDIPDDFWDLSSLLPKKRPPVMRERKPDVETVTIELGAPDKTKDRKIGSLSVRFREVSDKPLKVDVSVQLKMDKPQKPTTDGELISFGETVRSSAQDAKPASDDKLKLPARSPRTPTAELIDEYEPAGGLIRRVRVMKWPSRYSFYEQFRHDAKRYAEVKGTECPEVDFFSYTPQYRQMSKAQLAYYFWWRENAIREEWIPASFSYILLYIYEVINLNELIPPEEGLHRLVGVWGAYREKHKVLDKYLSEWVTDYCLIHRLPAPREKLAPMMHAVMANASFREFYMAGGDEGITAETLIDLSSDYNWQKSKFAAQDEGVRAQYRRHIPAAVAYVAEKSGDDRFSTRGMKSAVVSRDAFCGSLCAHNVKCRIDIEYLSYTRSRELRTLLTELVKYSENRLRAALGIRSRLRVTELDDRFRSLADEYFDREFPSVKKPTKASRAEEEERLYDAAYDALTHGVDAAGAAEIERASWASTELLAPEFGTGSETAKAVADMTVAETEKTVADMIAPDTTAPEYGTSGAPSGEVTENDGILSRLDAVAVGYLRTVLTGTPSDALEYCREHSLYADEVASRINETASEVIGDIILEPDGEGGYTVIEDYIDEIR